MFHNKIHTSDTNKQNTIEQNTIEQNTNKKSNSYIEYLITMEKYRFNECHGGC